MKLSRRTFLRSSALAGLFTGSWLFNWFTGLWGGAGTGAASSAASQPASAAPAPTPTPQPYEPDTLTGLQRTASRDARLVAVMINNISHSARQNARPQRGLGDAGLLIEAKVEGGITRFCAVFSDVDDIAELGPIRSGRDQFLQLVMPWRALYYHDGESIFCTQFVHNYRYWDLNIGGKSYFNTPTHAHVAHRDSRGRDVAFEHTEFTSGAEIRKAAANAGISLDHTYSDTFFPFMDYRTGERNTLEEGAPGTALAIRHSEHYRTGFTWDKKAGVYRMWQYSRADGSQSTTVDENTGKALTFTNVLVCFAGMAAYAGDSHDVQSVVYEAGGDAYYYSGGRMLTCRWEKKAVEKPLRILTRAGDEVLLNPGKTYLAIVDAEELAGYIQTNFATE